MSSADEPNHWAELLASIYGERRWIVTSEVLAGTTDHVEWLRALGCPDPFIIAGSLGTGPLPDVPDDHIGMLGVGGAGLMSAIRAFYEAAHSPLPADIQHRLDTWDPDGTATVLASFLDVDLPIGGRSQFGARPPAWAALEDKLIVDALWDEAGITRAPSMTIPIGGADINAARATLDRGAGIVLAGDNREGWYGGGELVRFVHSAADVEPVSAYLAAHCDRARAMPFLVGIPCSIHGVVFPDYVLTVRPAEMVMFRDAQSRKFGYAGPAGNWQPPAADIEYMRNAAVAAGEYLRSHYGFRGVFTIDGVMTEDGFRPTELNPRWGGGLRAVTGDSPVASLAVHRALVAGVEADWRPAELESSYREAGRNAHLGRGITLVQPRWTETESVPIRWKDGEWEPADEGEGAGTLTRGPASAGGLLRVDFTPNSPGTSVAPAVLAAWRLANRLWDAGIPAMTPAEDVRRG